MKGIYLSSFLAYASLSAVIPVIPSYAMDIGADKAFAALISGSFALSTALAMTPFGVASDRIGRAPFVVCGFALYLAAPVMYMISASPQQLLIARLIHGFGTAMYLPALNALVADEAAEGRKGEAIGWLTTSLMLGFVVGPLIGGVIAAICGATYTFLLSFILSAAAFSTALTFARNFSAVRETQSLSINRSLAPYLAAIAIATAASSSLALFAIPISSEFIGKSFAGASVSALFLSSASVRVLAGRLSDTVGSRITAIIGAVVESAGLALASIGVGYYAVSAIVCGVGMGFVNTASFAAAARSESRGFAMGLSNTALNAGIFGGAALAGMLASSIDLSHALLVFAGVSFLIAPLLAVLSRE